MDILGGLRWRVYTGGSLAERDVVLSVVLRSGKHSRHWGDRKEEWMR